MKQTKTTLIFGVLLAIIVIVWVALEINSISQTKGPDKIENATLVPIAKKTLSILKEVVSFR